MRSDFHTHTLCSPDSSSPADQVVAAAIERGLDAIAITDHAEMVSGRFGFASPGCNSYSTYAKVVSSAADRYKGNIKVLKGVEVGYRIEFEPVIREFLGRYEFDMTIGSVHDSLPVDWWDPASAAALRKNPELGVRALRWYFTQVESAASSRLFGIIAHIDIYERYLPGMWPDVFSDPSLVPAVEKAVAAIAEHSRMEINLCMFNQHGKFARSALPFLRMYREMGGRPPAIGSDAHRLSQVGLSVEAGEALAREAGFNQVANWSDVIGAGK